MRRDSHEHWKAHPFMWWQMTADGRAVPNPEYAHRVKREREIARIRAQFSTLKERVRSGQWRPINSWCDPYGPTTW